jgi:NitT/TauT family transport system substrate-binding protein
MTFCLGLVLWLVLALPWISFGRDVMVYESWVAHMESAGGWVAADQGMYGKLKVIQVQGGPGISPIHMVAAAIGAGNIAFGNDSPENILRVRQKEGIDLVAVSVDFQTSAMRILSWNPIQSIKDLRGDFGIWVGHEAKAKCLVGQGGDQPFTIQTQGGDIRPWLDGRWPLASAMTYDELILVQREVKRMGKTFYTIDYKDLGIDWMDKALFTTSGIIQQYPDVVQGVVMGRYRGFKWALANPREAFEILKRVNDNIDFYREMDAVDPIKALMITTETRQHGLGYIQPTKWRNVAGDMVHGGLLDRIPDVKKVYTERFPSRVLPR